MRGLRNLQAPTRRCGGCLRVTFQESTRRSGASRTSMRMARLNLRSPLGQFFTQMKNSSGESTGLLSALAQQIKAEPGVHQSYREISRRLLFTSSDDGFSLDSPRLKKARETPC